MQNRWLRVSAYFFGLWSLWVFARYETEMGTYDPLWAGFLNVFLLLLKNWTWVLGALAAAGLVFWIFRRKIISFRPVSLRHLYFWPAAALTLPFLVWPAYQLALGAGLPAAAKGLGGAALTLVFAAAALGAGLKLVRYLGLADESPAEKTVLALALGFGTFMFCGLLFGTLGLFYRSAAAGFLFGALVFGAKELLLFFRGAKKGLDAWLSVPGNRKYLPPLLSALFIALTLFSAGIFFVYPPGYDAKISYFTFAKEYAANHRLVSFPYWVYWGFPQNGEMLFTLAWLLGGYRPAIGIIFIFALLLGAALILLLRRTDMRAKIIALLLFFTLPVLAYETVWEHKSELLFAFYVLLSYALLMRYAEKRSTGYLLALGITSGLAAGLKYFFFPWYALPIAAFMLWKGFKDSSWFRSLVVWALISGALFLPWAVKNIIASGNPLDPAGSLITFQKDTFLGRAGSGARAFTVTEMRNESYLLWDDEEQKSLSFFLRLPFHLTFIGNKKYLSSGLTLGPLMLGLSPLMLFILWRKRRKLREDGLLPLALFLPLLILVWIYTGRAVIWYAIPIYGLWAVLLGWSLDEVREVRLRYYLLLLLGAWAMIFVSRQFFNIAVSPALSDVNHEKGGSLYRISEYINRDIPAESKVWGISEPQGYFIDGSFARFIPDNYHLTMSWLLENRGEAETVKFMRAEGIDYFLVRGYLGSPEDSVLMQWAGKQNGSSRYASLTAVMHMQLVDFIRKHGELIRSEGDLFLYRLK